ncbi:hypothetical protein CRG98_008642 [Punica granatum]|uniref:Uncharacterized protein n=1 Tax=Punica granatum TaxID=22663 RepID=A0A2I0KR34_PUNGR|nr:hypothetical protein CRG98_008642 [Punica granatum]
MTNDTSGRVPGTSRVSRDTPDLSRTPFSDRAPGARSTDNENRVPWVTRVHARPLRVPFRSTTLASCAITFKGFLTTLTLPREEVVTIRGPIHRAQPQSHSFPFIRFRRFSPSFLSLFRVCSSLGTLGVVRERLGLPLKSPRSPISRRAVAGASVPTSFFPSCHGCPLSGTVRNNVKDPPKLKPGQGVFGHSPLRGGRIIRDLVGVSVGLSIILKSVLGIVRNYISF